MDEKEIEKLQQERNEYLDGWKRAKADFLNYKKEEEERMRAMAGFAQRKLLQKILPILDNLARAEKEIPEDQKGNQVCKGFLQIVSQWQDLLKSEGIEQIETVGKPFNPESHEAVSEVQGAEGEKSGMIVEELEKGYIMRGKLLRPAKVKIVK